MNDELVANTALAIGISDLSAQETHFIQGIMRGMPPVLAAENAGYAKGETQLILNKPNVAQTISYLRQQQMSGFEVTRDTVTGMLFEAYSLSANATEMVSVARELAKLHGLNAPTQTQINVTHENKTEQQMKEMSTDELAKIAGDDAIDAEWTEVEDDD